MKSRFSLPRTLSVLAALACASAMSACASKSDVVSPAKLRPFNVVLDFFPNADHAALFSAIAHGDFQRAGLQVHTRTPASPSEPLNLLAAGKADLVISYEPELLLARDQGLKVISIGALVQRPLTSIIALPASHVKNVRDLAQKTVGTAGIGYQTSELQTVLTHAGVRPGSVKQANVGYDLIPAMLSGKVAATLGGFWNYEGLQLELMHRHPVVIPVDQAGVPTYDELVLVIRQDEARNNGAQLRAFLTALTRGQEEVREDPAQAAQLIKKANPSVELKLQQLSVQRTLPANYPSSTQQPYGYQDPQRWASFARWMFNEGLLHTDPDSLSQPFTNEFLPGQGLKSG